MSSFVVVLRLSVTQTTDAPLQAAAPCNVVKRLRVFFTYMIVLSFRVPQGDTHDAPLPFFSASCTNHDRQTGRPGAQQKTLPACFP